MEELELNMEILAKLEKDVQDLKKNYEAYFMGMERIPPERELVRIQGIMRKLRNIYTNNTAVKFRRESLVAKFQSYHRYWMRIMKEIEDGRYVRDRFKADLHMGKQNQGAAAKKPVATKEGGQDMDKLYKEYMTARIECNQGTEGLSKDKLASSIKKSLPQLKQRYKGKNVEFRVVIEGGKAKLKALPK